MTEPKTSLESDFLPLGYHAVDVFKICLMLLKFSNNFWFSNQESQGPTNTSMPERNVNMAAM